MYIRLWQNLLTADSKSEVKFLKVLMPHNRQSCNHSNWSSSNQIDVWAELRTGMDGVGKRPHEIMKSWNSYSYLHDNSNALHHFIPKAHNNCSCCNTIRNSSGGRVRLSQRGVAYHSWSTRRCTLRIPGWPLSSYVPSHKGSWRRAWKFGVGCIWPSSFLAPGLLRNQRATSLCCFILVAGRSGLLQSGNLVLFGNKDHVHPMGQRGNSSTSDDVKFLGNSSAKPGSSKTPAGPEHVSGGAVQGGGTLSIIRL